MESLFIAWRLTGDPQYREWGWAIFEAIEKHCRIESGGYASVLNVDVLPVKLEDKMETFLMVRGPDARARRADLLADGRPCGPGQSETLKYLYLLFSDDTVLPLSSTSRVPSSVASALRTPRFPARIRVQHRGMPACRCPTRCAHAPPPRL